MPDVSDISPLGPRLTLFTAGKDSTYALGLTQALVAQGCELDFIGCDELTPLGLPDQSRIHFLNLRGETKEHVGLGRKIRRVLVYYSRLFRYAATAQPGIFHILWVNKLEWLDQTVLMLYYRLLGKKICFTAHNVNKARRDGHDSWLNRLTLKVHYNLCSHIFVHTGKMRQELMADFNQPENKISVIPLGMNVIVPITGLTGAEARQRLGLAARDKVILFFGNIAPYKGLELLVEAFHKLAAGDADYRLVIAGSPKGPPKYWAGIQAGIAASPVRDRILLRIEYVPEAETEWFFKAADVSVLPYRHIFQSGVLVLSYTFGLPVIAADVGSLREEIIEGKTGHVHEPGNAADLARLLQLYFASDLYCNLNQSREEIKGYAREKYSWAKVAALTTAVYAELSGATHR
jgi:glycosyltransferase involved in cell wall biosynthesis